MAFTHCALVRHSRERGNDEGKYDFDLKMDIFAKGDVCIK
jgi:hypothetical protein